MFETTIKAMAVMSSVIGGWLLVQAAWRRVFINEAERPAWCVGMECDGCQSRATCGTEFAEQCSQRDKMDGEPGGE